MVASNKEVLHLARCIAVQSLCHYSKDGIELVASRTCRIVAVSMCGMFTCQDIVSSR